MAILSEGDQSLWARLQASVAAKFQVIPANGTQEYDAPNPDFNLLVINLKAPASGRLELSVILQPSGQNPAVPVREPLAQVELSRWPQAPTK
jgi:hypothetical protein